MCGWGRGRCAATGRNPLMNGFPSRLGVSHLVASAGQEALDRDGASWRWKGSLHHAAHEGVDQRRGDLPPPLHLLQDLRTDASSEASLHLWVKLTLLAAEGHFGNTHTTLLLVVFSCFFFL